MNVKLRKVERKRLPVLLACGGLGMLLVGLIAKPLLAQVPQPVLAISLVSTSEFQIQITNGVGYATYEIYRQWELDPSAQWILHMIGTQGQTNFTTNMGIFSTSFFQAGVGTDWDGDGIPNFQDAQPTSTNAGALSITIISPANGANLQ